MLGGIDVQASKLWTLLKYGEYDSVHCHLPLEGKK